MTFSHVYYPNPNADGDVSFMAALTGIVAGLYT